MAVLFRVGAKSSGDRRLDIQEFLSIVEPEGVFWKWALFPMGEGTEITGEELPTGPPFDGKTVYEFGKLVEHSSNGSPLTWEQLRTLAKHVRQTIWGTYVACIDMSYLSRLKALYLDNWMYIDRAATEYYELVECVFQAVDSSYWLVYLKDELLRKRIISAVGEQACEVISFRNSILLAESEGRS